MKPTGNEKLDKLRERIDAVDESIAALLEQRLAIAREIGKTKENGAVFDPAREKDLIAKLAKGHPDVDSRALENIMTEIISFCRAVQKRPTVAALGPEGSYSEQAAFAGLGKSIDVSFFDSPEQVVRAIERKEADLGVIPVENTIEGVVYSSLDAFASAGTELVIAMEVLVPIRHVLAGRAENLEAITEVRSHPQALAQCRLWLSSHLPHVPKKPSTSTSAAAAEASEDENLAAICSERAAQKHRLHVLARNIQDHPDNTTRFWVIGNRREISASSEGKISVLFTVAHKPGSLFHALEPLRDRGVNLTFIQSRPLASNPFEYFFFVDMEAGGKGHDVFEALDVMASRCFSFRLLGAYPSRKCY